MINLGSIKDAEYKKTITKEVEEIVARAKERCEGVLSILNKRKD